MKLPLLTGVSSNFVQVSSDEILQTPWLSLNDSCFTTKNNKLRIIKSQWECWVNDPKFQAFTYFIPFLVLDNAYFRSITNTSIIYFTTSVNIYNTVFTTINNSARLLLFKFTYLLGVKYRHNNNHQNTQNKLWE